jgi:hypothetical protein
MPGADRLHSRTSAPASDVVVETIPDRETEVNHYYSPQWKKIIFCSYFIDGACVELRSLHLVVPTLNCGLHMVSNGRPDTCSSTRRNMEDPGTFGINSRIFKTTETIGRRTVPTTMTYLGCTMCISICKFLKSIKCM